MPATVIRHAELGALDDLDGLTKPIHEEQDEEDKVSEKQEPRQAELSAEGEESKRFGSIEVD